MKRIALAIALAALAGSAGAADKTYQVTGPVVEVKPDTIVVQKGKENWEIAKGDVKTEVKKGDSVTVKYKMTATSIDVKTDAKSGKKK
jgi:hypothetical protein